MQRPRRSATVFFCAAWLCALAACASYAPITLRTGTREFTTADYESVYRAWTRETTSFDFGSLQDVLNVSATFESWEFRWAYVIRYAADFGYDTTQRTAMLHAALDEASNKHLFFVTLSGRQWRETQLTGDRSAWRVLLVDDADRGVVPAQIEYIRKPGGRDKIYFPQISPFRHTYRISFPAKRDDGTDTISPNTHAVTLRFTGSVGTVDLRWEMAAAANGR